MESGVITIDTLTRIILWVVCELALGVIYAAAVDWIDSSWPSSPFTVFEVVGGVTLTLIVTLLVLPLTYVAVVYAAFVLSGLPNVLGALRRNANRARTERESAHKIAVDELARSDRNDRGGSAMG